jgi:competence protein ComEC
LNYIDNTLKVTVIDVGQGDSIFIKLPNNQGNLLIDTGGIISYDTEKWKKRKNNYSITQSKTIPYLKSLGLNHLDYLILTHGDADHMGESINLINKFKINNVIFNKGEYNKLETNLINVLKSKKISYYKSKDILNINNYKFYFLNSQIYNDENSNSNIIYFKYNNYSFIFMGDATREVEEKIINDYHLENITFLKVGHHGSNTSTSSNFIKNINPKISLISVGENNRYGHPKEEVLTILKNTKIYRTDLEGSILIKIKNKCILSTFPNNLAASSQN